MNTLLDHIRDAVRSVMNYIARAINYVGRGHITPNMITFVGLFAHIYIAWLIAQQSFVWAAILLVIFGLFDTLDGQLARLQNRATNTGMLLDASTDRMKEVILYIGVAYAFIQVDQPYATLWTIAACGGSIIVSYVKAKGELAVKDSGLSANQINRLFQDGFFRYEIRMFALVVGLLINQLEITIILIAVLAWFTAFQRLYLITRKL